MIAAGGYTRGLIRATAALHPRAPALSGATGAARGQPARVDRRAAEAGWVHYFAPYEAVHRGNIKTVLAR